MRISEDMRDLCPCLALVVSVLGSSCLVPHAVGGSDCSICYVTWVGPLAMAVVPCLYILLPEVTVGPVWSTFSSILLLLPCFMLVDSRLLCLPMGVSPHTPRGRLTLDLLFRYLLLLSCLLYRRGLHLLVFSVWTGVLRPGIPIPLVLSLWRA